jgi:hypothetical protein
LIPFLWSEFIKNGEIYGRMIVKHGDKYMDYRKVYGWVKVLKGGRKNVDDAHSERSSSITCVEVVQKQIDRIIGTT